MTYPHLEHGEPGEPCHSRMISFPRQGEVRRTTMTETIFREEWPGLVAVMLTLLGLLFV